MIIRFVDCRHCGVEYKAQFSGSYDATGIPKEYQDQKYCPDCKKAIVEALAAIPVLFTYKHVPTTEVSLEELVGWEKLNLDDKRGGFFPPTRRVFATAYDRVRGEYSVMEEVIGRDNYKGREYHYKYWPSRMHETLEITVLKKVELATGREIAYKIR